MARLNTIGFELNSTVAGVEYSQNGAGIPSISTTTIRSGAYSLRANAFNTGQERRARYQFILAAGNGPFYIRAYVNFATFPSAANRFITLANSNSANTNVMAYITVDNTGALTLFDEDGQIGSASAALSTGTWYRIEMKYDRTAAAGSQTVEAKIDGVVFATAANRNLSAGIFNVFIGGNLAQEAQTQGDWFYDDIAINDSNGASQNSYPGAGQVVYLRPNAAGDNNAFTVQVGGTVGAANNYTRVSEVTPDDATSYNGDAVVDHIDDFNIDATPSSIGASDTINVVQVGVRFRAVVAAAEAPFVVRAKKTTGGTVAEGALVSPTATTWLSNTESVPINPGLTLYNDPDGNPWTKATLDTAQIGYRIQATNTNAANISSVWLIVDSTPAAPVSARLRALLGVGL